MADIFLSYAREDAARAAEVVRLLGQFGWSVFWDRDIPAGSMWRDVLERELPESKCVLVLWSAASVTSHWVVTEASLGRERGALVPARLDATNLPLEFHLLHAAQLQSWTGNTDHPEFLMLIAGIAAHVNPGSGVTVPSVPETAQTVHAVPRTVPSSPPFGAPSPARTDPAPTAEGIVIEVYSFFQAMVELVKNACIVGLAGVLLLFARDALVSWPWLNAVWPGVQRFQHQYELFDWTTWHVMLGDPLADRLFQVVILGWIVMPFVLLRASRARIRAWVTFRSKNGLHGSG